MFSVNSTTFRYVFCETFYVFSDRFTLTVTTCTAVLSVNNHKIFFVAVVCENITSVLCTVWHYNSELRASESVTQLVNRREYEKPINEVPCQSNIGMWCVRPRQLGVHWSRCRPPRHRMFYENLKL